MQANPAVADHFHHEREQPVPGVESGILIAFLKDPSQRPPIDPVAGQLMGGIRARFPARWLSCSRIPCWRSAPARPPIRRASSPTRISGIDPNEVYDTAGKMMAKMHEYPGFLFVNSDLYNHTPNLQVDILRDQAKLYGVSETPDSHAAARRLFAELQLPDQEADRSIPGDSGSGRRPALRPAGSEPALHQERRRPAHGSAERGHQLASGHRTAGSQSHQPIHQRDHVLQPEARATPSARPRSSSRKPPSRFCRRASMGGFRARR